MPTVASKKQKDETPLDIIEVAPVAGAGNVDTLDSELINTGRIQ